MEKEVSEAERRVSIKKTYSEKIALLIKQEVNEKELYAIIRRFFADFLKLEYEFTYEELSQELNKIFIKQALKQRIDQMLEDLSWLEYMPDHELTQEEKKKILNDFRSMIEQLIIDLEEKPGKASFFDKLFGKKKNEEEINTPLMQQQGPTQESLPEVDANEVTQKNQEILQELRSEMIQKEESKQVFSDFVNKIDNSNNLLLFTDPLVETTPEEKVTKEKIIKENITKEKVTKELKETKPRLIRKNIQTSPKEGLPKYVSEGVLDFSRETPEFSQKLPENIPSNISSPLLAEDNNPEMIALKELIAQSYNIFSSGNTEYAKLKYMDALSIYNKFDYEKKTRTYLELYDLYKKLK